VLSGSAAELSQSCDSAPNKTLETAGLSMLQQKWLAYALFLAVGCGADDRPATWEYISPVIMQPNCATVSCHSRAAAVAGLDFSDPKRGYTSLMGLKVWVVDPQGTAGCRTINGSVVCQRDFRPLVTPYNPEQSRLVNMLRARGADRMPPDRPLDRADLELVVRWIRAGAPFGRPAVDAGSRDGIGITTTVTLSDGTMIITASDGTRTIIDRSGHLVPPDAGGEDVGGPDAGADAGAEGG
jgi:hypothetical protein